VLQELTDVTARPFTTIFERLWRLGEVPEEWKRTNANVIFKKVKKEDPGNYRPVSFTCIPRKMMEKILLENISIAVQKKKLIGSIQHEFIKGK